MEVNSNKSIAVNRTSLQSVLRTMIGVNKRRQHDRYYNNTPTMRSRCQHTDQKGQVSMTEIDRWRNRSEYTKQKLKEEPNQTIRRKTIPRPIMLQQMKKYCDKMKNIWGKTTNEHDEQLCREGNELIEEFLRDRETISNNDSELIGWANTVSKILDRCRWIECRPKENITNEPSRMSSQDKVMRQWERMKQRQMN